MRWRPVARALLGVALAIIVAGCSGSSEHAKAREVKDRLQVTGVIVAEQTQGVSLVVSYLVDGANELEVPGVAAEPEPPYPYLPRLLTPLVQWNLKEPPCGVEAYEVTGEGLRRRLVGPDTLEQVRAGRARLVQVYITCDASPNAHPSRATF